MPPKPLICFFARRARGASRSPGNRPSSTWDPSMNGPRQGVRWWVPMRSHRLTRGSRATRQTARTPCPKRRPGTDPLANGFPHDDRPAHLVAVPVEVLGDECTTILPKRRPRRKYGLMTCCRRCSAAVLAGNGRDRRDVHDVQHRVRTAVSTAPPWCRGFLADASGSPFHERVCRRAAKHRGQIDRPAVDVFAVTKWTPDLKVAQRGERGHARAVTTPRPPPPGPPGSRPGFREGCPTSCNRSPCARRSARTRTSRLGKWVVTELKVAVFVDSLVHRQRLQFGTGFCPPLAHERFSMPQRGRNSPPFYKNVREYSELTGTA